MTVANMGFESRLAFLIFFGGFPILLFKLGVSQRENFQRDEVRSFALGIAGGFVSSNIQEGLFPSNENEFINEPQNRLQILTVYR